MSKTKSFFIACILSFATSTGFAAEWQHTNGLNDESINALSVNGTHIFAGTRDSGVFRSDDNGSSWLAVNTGLTNLNIRGLATKGTYLFAGTQDSGVFRSDNNGTSWLPVNTGISTTRIKSLAVNDSFLFVGTDGGGVCRSSDYGTHWLEVNKLEDGTELHAKNIYAFGITSMYVFIGTWAGSAFRSGDNGMTWYLVTNGMADPRENQIPYSFAVGDTFIFAGTDGGGVFRARDSARAWFPANTGLPDSAKVTALALYQDTLFAATQNGIFRSTNDGANWVKDGNELPDSIVDCFVVSGTTLFAGTIGGGIWIRTPSAITIPIAPVLTLPSNGDSGIATNPTLRWNPSSGAHSYALQVSNASDFATFSTNQSGLTSTSYTESGLSKHATYYWRVNASNAAGTSGWTAPRSFSTVSASSSPPVAMFPDSNTIDMPTALSISWRSGLDASSYHIQLSTSASFSPLLLNATNVNDTMLSLSGLVNSTSYFWRVATVTAEGPSPWSRSMLFTTICELPAQVVALPTIDTLGMEIPLFKWQMASPTVTAYHLLVWSDSLLTTAVASDSTIADTAVIIKVLANDHTYWWRVRAYNIAGWGPFSVVSKLTVRNTTPFATVSPLPVAFSRPSLHFDHIRYALSNACFVTLVAYDARGRSIRTYISSQQSAGNYRIALKQASMASGRYFLRFVAGTHKETTPVFID